MLEGIMQIQGIKDGIERGKKYEFVLAHFYSEVLIGKTIELIDMINKNWEELMEIRFFSPAGEVHLWKEGEVFCGIECKDEKINLPVQYFNKGKLFDEIIMDSPVASSYHKFGKELEVKQYLDYDEDGQAYIVLTRLNDLKEGNCV
jgi:hypothetical protein